MPKLTKPQLTALRNARDNGCPWREADGSMTPNTSSSAYRRMLERLEAQGLLYGGKITLEGKQALADAHDGAMAKLRALAK